MDTIFDMNIIALSIIGLIIVLFFCTFIFSILIRKTYGNLIKDINDKENRKNRLFKYRMMNDIVDDFNVALSNNVEEINTVAIIEKNMFEHMKAISLGERFVKKAVSMMIILGLLGTFYGLILSIQELVKMLSDTQQIVGVETITEGLISSITGMSVAFVTSMFGIGASILTNIMNIAFGLLDSKENLVIHIEEFLDNNLMLSNNGLGPVDAQGNTALSLSFDRFNETLTTSLRNVTDEITTKMSQATSDMVLTAESLKSSVVRFDHSLNQFSDNIRDFTEFNHHLRSNIQRLAIGFENFSEEMEKNVSEIKQGQDQVDKLNQTLERLQER
ncbi:MAG: MotA/TolQ/ExbB proton channel family protein [Clostridia bacterium]|nr:MotA/TolQ/ExbB proton channel family protein [Clostridia bacterium]